MPEYVFKCSSDECGAGFFKTLAIVNRNAPQDCPTCGADADKQIASGVGGVLRGDVWPGKNIQVKKQMAARRAKVGEREHVLKMDGPQFNLAPNVNGERVDSWEDASKLAASEGKDTREYDKRARQAKRRGSRA
jgi:putative FmdB family regulatory protein